MLTAANLVARVSVAGAAGAEAELASMGGAVSLASGGLTGLGKVSSGLGGALSHAKSAIGGLLTGPLGMIALGGGALGLAGFIKSGIDKVTALGLAVEKLGPITGDTVPQVSALLAVFNKFGISTDTATTRLAFMQKALGTLTLQTTSSATQQYNLSKAEDAVALAEAGVTKARNAKGATTASVTAAELKLTDAEMKLTTAQQLANGQTAAGIKFQTEFGFSIYDSSGKVADANTILGRAADYWNGSATASQKAALEAKLFGRGFASMIPILNLGSKGIADAETAATNLGETLTAQNAGDLAAYTSNMRTLGAAVNGLQLQIGLVLIPVISGLASSLSGWLSSGGSAQLLTWFKDAVTFAQQVGSAIQTVVVPAIHMIASAWDSIPGPVKTLILGAFLANKAVKWLFGIDATSIAKAGIGLAASFLGKLGGSIAGSVAGGAIGAVEDVAGVRVFVTNWAMMGGAGAAEDVVGAGEAAAGGGGIFSGIVTAFTTGVVAPLSAVAVAAAALAGIAVVTEHNTSAAWAASGVPQSTWQNLSGGQGAIQTRNPAWTAQQTANLTANAATMAALQKGSGASVQLMGEHSGLGDKLVAARNAATADAQKTAVAMAAMRAAEVAASSSNLAKLAGVQGSMDDVRSAVAHAGTTDANYASAGLGVQRQILAKKPTLSVKITPTQSNLIVDGKVLAHTIVQYFPLGVGGTVAE